MKFPKTIRHRKSEVVIYGKRPSYPFYRICWKSGGKRQMRSLGTYSEALAEAEKKVRELSAGDQTLSLTAKEASDALAIRDALDTFRKQTGQSISPIQAVAGYLEAARKLDGRSLGDVVDTYLSTLAIVRTKDLGEAVEEFLALRAPKAEAVEGKRSALNPKYVANVESWLRQFSTTFSGHKLEDLSKDLLNRFFKAFKELSVKSRNDRRITLRLFFKWCVRNDYLPATHRLNEADAMMIEAKEEGVIDFYRPGELHKLLKGSSGAMRAVIAIQALAGLRLEEALRLDWSDVFKVEGHIEISSAKSKTRSRRLAEIGPALAAWLEPHKESTGKVANQWETPNGYVQAFIALRKKLKVPSRKNGLRHGFVTFHYALHQNENMTAALAGHSPTMLHGHYRGLATKAEAEKWFSVEPTKQ
ncbi:MAG: site-specific integrase [Verrucomicrobiales bacterium]|nr:site-specific integrase [Verrucomicrobiales bacterium]